MLLHGANRGDKRGRSTALFFAVLNGTSTSDPEPVNFSYDPENASYLRVSRKRHHLRSHQFSSRAAILPLLGWFPACVAHVFCNPEDPDALGDDSSFFAVTQQQWRAWFRRMLRCKLACILPPTSGSQISFRSFRGGRRTKVVTDSVETDAR